MDDEEDEVLVVDADGNTLDVDEAFWAWDGEYDGVGWLDDKDVEEDEEAIDDDDAPTPRGRDGEILFVFSIIELSEASEGCLLVKLFDGK